MDLHGSEIIQTSTLGNIKVTKRIHTIWIEYAWIEEKDPKLARAMPPTVGKYQYIYESKKGAISLVELPEYFREMGPLVMWEIYSLEGDLFNDIERYMSKEDAEQKIKEYLE